MDFLLVIPAFEESQRLPRFLAELAPTLQACSFRTSILVVDDGSRAAERDALIRAIRPLREQFPAIAEPLLLPENIGKGGAIMAGWNQPTDARWLAFVDADGAISATEVRRVFDLVLAANDTQKSYFASRIRMLGRTIRRNVLRHLMGRIYASLVGRFIDSRIYDSQCGFKIVAAPAWKSVGRVIEEHRFAFDVDLTAALLSAGSSIEEIPIDWTDQAGSKVSPLRDTAHMIRSVFRIRSRRRV